MKDQIYIIYYYSGKELLHLRCEGTYDEMLSICSQLSSSGFTVSRVELDASSR